MSITIAAIAIDICSCCRYRDPRMPHTSGELLWRTQMTTQAAIVEPPCHDRHGRNGRATTQARVLTTSSANGMPLAQSWRARVIAERGTDPMPWTFTTSRRENAERAGVRARCEDDRYELSFEVCAGDLALATRAAMARWARLYELYALPDWPLVSVSVDHIAVADQGDAAASAWRRRAPSDSLRRSPGSLTSLSTVEDVQIDPIRTEVPARVGSSRSDRALAGSTA